MLTKEECLKALRTMQYHLVRDFTLCNLKEYDENGKPKWVLKPRYQNKVNIIKQLINEHFELLEKYQNLQDENARLSFDKIVNNIEDMNYKLWLENPPLKFEELKEGMWVWDNKYKDYVKFERHDIDDGVGKVLILSKGFDDECVSIFRENRFYRKQVE